jgi:hypothetical protein
MHRPERAVLRDWVAATRGPYRKIYHARDRAKALNARKKIK